MRLLHVGEEPVRVRAWAAGGRVRFRAEAPTREAAAQGIERMRFALGTDHDLSEFHRRFRRDPLLGPVIRFSPGCGRAAAPSRSRRSPGRSASS